MEEGAEVDDFLTAAAGEGWCEAASAGRHNPSTVAAHTADSIRETLYRGHSFVATGSQLQLPLLAISVAPVLDLVGMTERGPALVEVKCGRTAGSNHAVGSTRQKMRGAWCSLWDTWRNRAFVQLSLQVVAVLEHAGRIGHKKLGRGKLNRKERVAVCQQAILICANDADRVKTFLLPVKVLEATLAECFG